MAFILPTSGNETIIDLILYDNMISGGWLGIGVLFTFWVIFFVTLLRFNPIRAFTTSSFIIALLAVLFRVMGLVQNLVMLSAIVLFILSFAALYFMQRQE